MTPVLFSLYSTISYHMPRTKRVPQYQGQLWHLFALLAQLQESRFAGTRLHELRDPVENAFVLFRHADVGVGLNIVGRSARDHVVIDRQTCAIVARDTIVVVLLRRLGRLSSSLSLHLTVLGLCLK